MIDRIIPSRMAANRMKTRFLGLIFLSAFIVGLVASCAGCRHGQNFGRLERPDLNKASECKPQIHDKGFLNSRVMYFDFETKRVQVVTLEGTRFDILFEPQDEFLDLLRKPAGKAKIYPVTFVCPKKLGGETCDLNKPFIVYVATCRVNLVKIQRNFQNGPKTP